MRCPVLVTACALLAAACSIDPGSGNLPAAAASSTAPAASTSSSSTTTSSTTPPATSTSTTTSTTTTTTTTVPPPDRSDEAAAARMQADLSALLSNGPRLSGTRPEEAAAWYFARTAAAITGAPVTIQAFPLPGRGDSQNVWAAPVGSGDRVLLVGAHLDSWAGSPGADDNGSGLVVSLELLRRLSEDPPRNLQVVVAGFGAEEWVGDHGHHFGSRLAAAEMADGGTLPDWMISVDMVGIGPTLQSIELSGFDGSLADLIADVGASIGAGVVRNTRGEISDHEPFAHAGVPSVLLYRPGNPDYHEPGDDHVDDRALVETLAVVEAVVARLDAGG